MLAILRAIDGIQPDRHFAPSLGNDHRIAVADEPNLGFRKAFYKLLYRRFTLRLLLIGTPVVANLNGFVTTGLLPRWPPK